MAERLAILTAEEGRDISAERIRPSVLGITLNMTPVGQWLCAASGSHTSMTSPFMNHEGMRGTLPLSTEGELM